jgi:ornithine cyclodeaminase
VIRQEVPRDVTVLPADAIRALLPMADAIHVVRTCFVDFSAGRILAPARMALPDGGTLVMLARRSADEGAVIKVVSIRTGNASLGLSTLQSTVLWLDGPTGQTVAILDGGTVTALRTGAASGVATALLAPEEASVLAMLGAGSQAADQIAAVCTVRPIREVRIWSRRQVSSKALAARAALVHPDVAFGVAADPDEAVQGAGVICTATPSRDSLFDPESLQEPVHINAIGAYRSDMRELPGATVAAADVLVVDSREAASEEAGDIIQARADGSLDDAPLPELGELLAADFRPERRGLSVFKSVGIGAQDWAVARLAVERAAAQDGLSRVSLRSSEA